MPESAEKRVVCSGCHQQCGLVVQLEGNRVTRIRGDREHPGSTGFVCPKGSYAHELHYHAARIHHPLKRVGPRGSGRWERISWEQALDAIATSIRNVTDAHGREALAYSFGTFHGADWGIGKRFMNLFDSPNAAGQDKICYGPGALGEALTYGFGPSFFSFPIPGKTRCMVVWGLRPSASMPLLWRQILAAQRAGAKLIVVDPERGREAQTADLWLQNNPGTDAALALSLIHCVIEEGRYDAAFVESQTIGFTDLRERAAQYAPAHAAALTRVPSDKLVQAARMLTDNAPAIIHAGNGICQGGRGSVQTGRALACLIAITGNLGAPGGHSLTGPPHELIANGDVFADSALSPAQRRKRLGAERFPFLGGGFSELDAAMSRTWYGKRNTLSWIDSAHEPTLWQAITHQQPYPVKALILQHHNPVGASPNAAAVAAALASPNLELLVAHDLFETATSRLADYLLPAAHWLEKPFYSMGLAFIGFAGDYVEASAAPLAPEFEHRSDYDFWRDLAGRLDPEQHWPERAEDFWEGCLKPAGLDFASVAANLGPLFGPAARHPNAAPDSQTRPTYGTPSGKVELRSSLIESWGLDPLPGAERPAIFDDDPTGYPLILTTGGRKLEGYHQDSQHTRLFRRKYPEPRVRLHPETAVRSGVADGEWAWIETPVGRVRQLVQVTEDLLPDVVHADRWWYPERGGDTANPFGWRTTNINVCTEGAFDSCDSIMGTWLLRGVPCRVVPEPEQECA